MKVIVTGGAGFIGSHIVDQLVAGGHEVIVIDDLDPAAHDGEPTGLADAARYVWGDVRDPDLWDTTLNGVDAVCHQAAKVGLGVDFGDVEAYVGRNVAGTAAMLAALHRNRFAGRVVLASSMVVYGEGRYRCDVDGLVRPGPRRVSDLEQGLYDPLCPVCNGSLLAESVPEDHGLEPRNVYATTKLAQEGLCNAFAREHADAVVACLRYHNVYGPRMPRDTPYAGVASIFRSAYANGRVPLVMEDGGQLRDFVHVTDVARANVIAMTTASPSSGAFNICSGIPHTVLEMAEALRPSGSDPPAIVGGFRLGDIRHVFADPSRAQTVLGFRASVPFEAGMREFSTTMLRQARPRDR